MSPWLDTDPIFPDDFSPERSCRESQAGTEYERSAKPIRELNWCLIAALIANFALWAALIIWGIIWLIGPAKADSIQAADDGDLTAPAIIIQHRQVIELEKRIKDLEINMQAQIAKPCACVAPAATEISESETVAFNRCLTKIKRFVGTEASDESRARFLWHCGYQAGVWQRRDP